MVARCNAEFGVVEQRDIKDPEDESGMKRTSFFMPTDLIMRAKREAAAQDRSYASFLRAATRAAVEASEERRRRAERPASPN